MSKCLCAGDENDLFYLVFAMHVYSGQTTTGGGGGNEYILVYIKIYQVSDMTDVPTDHSCFFVHIPLFTGWLLYGV